MKKKKVTIPKAEETQQRVSLKNVPKDVMKIVIDEITEKMRRTGRINVSFTETLYGIVREWKAKKTAPVPQLEQQAH